MTKQTEALKLALEALEESLGYVQEEAENAQRLYGQYPARQARIQGLKDDARKHMDAITAIREALAEQCVCGEPDTLGTHRTDGPCLAEQPAQQQKEGFASPGGGYVPAIPRPMPLDWKLVPRKATPEMLKAMDECAQEGYDERLYAGMASSVYMAAWDASPVMGTLPDQPAQQQEPSEYVQKVIDALYENSDPTSIDAAELLEQMGKQQEPVAWADLNALTEQFNSVNCGTAYRLPGENRQPLYTSPQPSKPLTDEQILSLVPGLQDCLCDPWDYNNSGDYYASIPKDMIRLARAIEAKLKEKNT